MTPYNKHTDHTITAIAERRLYATKKYTTKPPLSIMHRLVVALIAVMGVVAHSFQATSVVGPLQSRIPIKGGDDDIEPNNSNTSKRRTFLISSVLTSSSLVYPFNQEALALPFLQQERRQLELCLVTLLRTKYWAQNVAKSINAKLLSPTTNSNSTYAIELSDTQRKQPYLEARLGAKAILTKKIGGGANSNVIKLAGFQLKECLDDGRYWCTELAKTNQLPGQSTGQLKNGNRFCSNELESISVEIIESLASLVEFDGLETTTDPSPRSSLMMNMYDSTKGRFVYRTLVERIIPSCDRYLQAFGSERLNVCQEFVRREYPDEMPIEVLQHLYDGAA
jgi:hypothetical protein